MEIKSVAVTGHTAGIGLAIYEHLCKFYQVKGYSRSTGYDIASDQDIEHILEDSIDCEIFVNNAYHYDQQTKLARAWEVQHRHLPHFIINISSLAADPMFTIEKKMPWLTEYARDKQRLNQVSFDITDRLDISAKSMTLMLGIVNTEFSFEDYYASHNYREEARQFAENIMQNHKLITPRDVAHTVKTMIDSIENNCFLYSVSLFNRF